MKVASLNESLLVRKGTAQPSPLLPAVTPGNQSEYETTAGGWSVRGAGTDSSSRLPGRHSPGRRNARRDDRVHVSLRLEPRRHVQLRLAAAHMRKSAQQILSEALARDLEETVPQLSDGTCACLSDVRMWFDGSTSGNGGNCKGEAQGRRPARASVSRDAAADSRRRPCCRSIWCRRNPLRVRRPQQLRAARARSRRRRRR